MIKRLLFFVVVSLVFCHAAFAQTYSWTTDNVNFLGTASAAASKYCATAYSLSPYGAVVNGVYLSGGARYQFDCGCTASGCTAVAPGTVALRSTNPVTPDCSDTAGEKKTDFVKVTGTLTNPGPMPGSSGGCNMAAGKTEVGTCMKDSTGTYCQFYYKNSGVPTPNYTPPTTTDQPGAGATPSPSTPMSAGSPTASCPRGTVQAGMDSSGIPICMGTGTDPVGGPRDKTAEKTTAAAVSTTEGTVTTTTQNTMVKNQDGSTTTTTDKTVTDSATGAVTVSSVTGTGLNTAGRPGTQDTPEDKSDLCKRNPMLSICRASTVSGTCEAIACDGDAIQCATLRAAAALDCRSKKDTDDLKASPLMPSGTAAAAGNDSMKASFPTVANGTVVTAPSSLDNNGWLGGGACFADKNFVILGKTIVMPFSKTCDSLLVLRYALMVVAALVSFKIVSGAILT